jgi:alkylation response protein AidB-like acyl-CoA dehydrogenase
MNAEDLDVVLGDPRESGNPIGHTAVLAADERLEMLAAGERALDSFGLNAEFVPAEYGGRFTRADRLAALMRTLCRRDPCLGLGYGFSSFIASVNVWSSGDEDQRRRAAGLLLANKTIAAGFHELNHGNDFAHADFTARMAGGGWLMSGRKEVVANIQRAAAIVLFARTSQAAGSRSHSQFLVVKEDLPAGHVRDMPRFLTSGLRGLQLGGAEFSDCPIPAGALIGEPGRGMEIGLRSFQITRSVLPAIFVGPLDAALRIAVECALERRLYGGAVADIPYVRCVIARAFADLLAIDAFSAVAVRGLHLVPGSMAVYASAVKYLTSRIVLDAFEDLRSVLGAQAYVRQGPYAMFQKLARDIVPATFIHVSRMACLVTLLPQLPRLARKSWLVSSPAPGSLFELGAELPELHLDLLSPGMPSVDGVAAALAEIAELQADGGQVSRFAARFHGELRALRQECAALTPSDMTIDASPAAFLLADRYTVVLAAACALAVWHHGRDRYPGIALLGVLDRLDGRLSGAPVLTESERESVEQRLFGAAVERYHDRRLFDLTARRIPG